MKIVFKIFLLLFFLMAISACGTAKKAFVNQKKNNSDEFLIEKKAPLTMPPDYNELPKPKENFEGRKKTNNIKNLIAEEEDSIEDDIPKKNLNLEESLLKKIKK